MADGKLIRRLKGQFNFKFCSKFVLLYIDYFWHFFLRLFPPVRGADLIIFDCSCIQCMYPVYGFFVRGLFQNQPPIGW